MHQKYGISLVNIMIMIYETFKATILRVFFHGKSLQVYIVKENILFYSFSHPIVNAYKTADISQAGNSS